MNHPARRITLDQWTDHYRRLRAEGLVEPSYGGPLCRHADQGDTRLAKLKMDNSAAALRLWNFLLSEEDRLRQAQRQGKKLVGAMKDLGSVPVMAYALDNLVAFCPDGAWWIPCMMELSAGLLEQADALGMDDSFCPVRAVLGAFVTEAHFPTPGLLTCSVGAVCDDISVISQRLADMGHDVLWWEIPHRRNPEPNEAAVRLPGPVDANLFAPASQVALVRAELQRVREALESYAGQALTDERLAEGIRRANRVRDLLEELRRLAFTADVCPMPALEMQIAEMLALHFCSDYQETVEVLQDLLEEIRRRVDARDGVLAADAVRVFWVNPVADLRVMNLLEDVGGRVCGTEYLFCHALDRLQEDIDPLEAIARAALSDPMVGATVDRARRILADARRFGAEALVVSRIPGASHCATEGAVIRQLVGRAAGIPTLEIEVPPITDSMEPTLRTRLEALVETVTARREA